jgi:hypothetical protein
MLLTRSKMSSMTGNKVACNSGSANVSASANATGSASVTGGANVADSMDCSACNLASDNTDSKAANIEFTGALELSRNYYFEHADSRLQRDFPALYPRLAIGLVGNGSERFGYDDITSTDHDWDIDFYIWVTDEDSRFLPALQQWKRDLKLQFPTSKPTLQLSYSRPPAAMTIANFYRELIGVPACPTTLGEWTRAPEENFALATNGAVFIDNLGEFSRIRNEIAGYYPSDIRLKKIAAACMRAAQTGQYNHLRMAKRGDWVSVRLALSHFCEAAMQLAFMLARKYRPYYKWLYRGLRELPYYGEALAPPLLRLALARDFEDESLRQQQTDIELICEYLAAAIRADILHKKVGASAAETDNFLASLGEQVQQRISDQRLRDLPTTYEL